jgi:hypothetical protein
MVSGACLDRRKRGLTWKSGSGHFVLLRVGLDPLADLTRTGPLEGSLAS